MARSSIATDNFNRASLGTDWAQLNAVTGGSISINSSIRAAPGADQPPSTASTARWVGAGTFSDDQYSSLVLIGVGYWTADYNCGVVVRAGSGTDGSRSYYGASVEYTDSGSQNTRLFKVVSGTYTSIYAAGVSWTDGDRIELEAEGTTLRVCKNGTPLGGSFTQTDSSLTTGLPGIVIGGVSVAYGDDWEGGNIGSATIAPHAMASYRMRAA